MVNIDDLLKEQKGIMDNHTEKYNHLRMKNRINHKKVNRIVNEKLANFDSNKKKRAEKFNLIRNKQQ